LDRRARRGGRGAYFAATAGEAKGKTGFRLNVFTLLLVSSGLTYSAMLVTKTGTQAINTHNLNLARSSRVLTKTSGRFLFALCVLSVTILSWTLVPSGALASACDCALGHPNNNLPHSCEGFGDGYSCPPCGTDSSDPAAGARHIFWRGTAAAWTGCAAGTTGHCKTQPTGVFCEVKIGCVRGPSIPDAFCSPDMQCDAMPDNSCYDVTQVETDEFRSFYHNHTCE